MIMTMMRSTTITTATTTMTMMTGTMMTGTVTGTPTAGARPQGGRTARDPGSWDDLIDGPLAGRGDPPGRQARTGESRRTERGDAP